MKKLLCLFLTALILSACGSGFDRQAAIDEVLDMHDVAMPKIGEVMSLKKKILEKAETASDSTLLVELRSIAGDLDAAQQGMMIWMREWGEISTPHVNGESSEEEQVAFFKSEMEKVTKVRDDIFNSIDAAKKKLN